MTDSTLQTPATRKRRAPLLSLLLLCALCAAHARPAPFRQADADGPRFLSMALPAGGEVRVENRSGGVRVEVWEEEQLALAYVTDGREAAPPTQPPQKGRKARARGKPAARPSPVQVERTDEALVIKVARGEGATARRVDLLLRVPVRARLKVNTSEGEIDVRGLPALLAAQTISGDLRLSVPESADADIIAQSLNGTVAPGGALGANENSSGASGASRQKFQTRLGAGNGARSVVNLFSGRGRITVDTFGAGQAAERGAPVAERREDEPGAPARPGGATAEERSDPAPERRAPVLAGSAQGRAGTSDAPRPAETPQEVDEDEVVRVDSDLVTLNVSVVERAGGRGQTGLAAGDFRLYEDDAEQQIEHFEAANAPFDLLLLIDLSGSTAKVTDLIRAAALRFIAAARPQDRISIVTFAGASEVVSPLTTNRQNLRAAVRAMQPPNGDTRLYDAVDFALGRLAGDAGESRRRAVILMSDGLDSTMPNVTGVGSTLPYEEVRRRVEEFDGIFYSIWTSTEYEAFSPQDIQPETFDLAHDRMEQLAGAGGGVFYYVERLEDLAGAYDRVIADLGTVYSLSYRPTNKARDGRWRTIRVRLPRHPDAVARGKRGYYAK